MQYGECLQMTNTLIYKFQPTNMADNKNDVIFFLGAGTLYSLGPFQFFAVENVPNESMFFCDYKI